MTLRDKHEIAKRSILDSARPLIGARGFSAVGIAQILVAARIPKGSFYHYFDSKERFGEDLLSLYIADYLATLENLFSAPHQNGYEKIRAYLKFWRSTHIDGKVGDKCLIVKLAAEMADLSETMREIMQCGTAKVIDRLTDVIQSGQKDGSINKELQASTLAAALYQTWLGATLMLKITKHTQPFDIAWQTSAHLLRGTPELL
ncbi:TetR/AcrR family transcriptional regulator [Acetobacter cibinongensis]|nr:TetR/AcrR family transcriptional regulator [Acetobacter cibinongensis]GBQ15635.1 TetR family transcriptional regulator [Acetobacter cibinongensis NRIC 0482]